MLSFLIGLAVVQLRSLNLIQVMVIFSLKTADRHYPDSYLTEYSTAWFWTGWFVLVSVCLQGWIKRWPHPARPVGRVERCVGRKSGEKYQRMGMRVWGLCQGVSTAVLYGSLALFVSILHNVFLLYYVETFVSVYKIDKLSFWVGEVGFLMVSSIT